jgi:hypothetical protein
MEPADQSKTTVVLVVEDEMLVRMSAADILTLAITSLKRATASKRSP